MNRDEALTETAMNVPPGAIEGEDPILYRQFEFTWQEYLARRTELINEPDDADAPEWARWKAQDGDGEWWWYQHKPYIEVDVWVEKTPRGIVNEVSVGKIPAGHEWRKTLKPVNQDMSQNEPVKSRNEPHAQDARRLDEQLNESIGYGRAAPRAGDILNAAAQHMQDRASTYDKPAGERSMVATVDAFRATTGINLTEEQGWHFMALLKLVRSQQGDLRLDSYEDGAAYFALAGEAAAKHR